PADPSPEPNLSETTPIRRYTHANGQFSIDYPATWQAFEQPDGTIFLSPDNQAGYSVFFNDTEQVFSKTELDQYLLSFVAQKFSLDNSNISSISRVQNSNGSVSAQFSATDPVLGETHNEIRVSQVETTVFALLITVSEPTWLQSSAQLQALVASFEALERSPEAAPELSAEEPVWMLTGPLSNRFGFLTPSDWETLHQSENSITVGLPDHSDIIFEARTFEWGGTQPDPSIAKEAALSYLASLEQTHDTFSHAPPVDFPLDSSQGTTVDFLYLRAEGDLQIAGSIISGAEDGQVYQVIFSAPADFYEGALQWFNPMYQSFRILSPDDLLEDSQ
ncbi:MAG: hypothetical protein R3264_13190, partial [Anaerolineae bacterium]|nr:hypothetical protein [Anaerolineae bacterium]